MAASKEQIGKGIERGIENGATHMIVVYDRWDYEDYPVYVYDDQSVENEVAMRNEKDMLKVMEVYNLSMDIVSQMKEYRAWHM